MSERPVGESVVGLPSRVVVVTGGARGIGEAIAVAFRSLGDRVVSVDLDRPVQPREGIEDLVADISDEISVADVFDGITTRFGQLDVLVNNAGVQRVRATTDLESEMWDLVVDTHLRGSFLCVREAIPLLRIARGSVVSVSSVAAMQGLPGRAPYSAAKAGLLGLTRALAVELAPDGIRVSAVAPGHTRTEMARRAFDDGVLTEADVLGRIPLARMADPSEIASAVTFLAGKAASYITGQYLVVDGGWSVQGMLGRPPGV
jgi:NAD(P)-dependent dehydrogenase (short-subunit alcohol dehydrogenase family)